MQSPPSLLPRPSPDTRQAVPAWLRMRPAVTGKTCEVRGVVRSVEEVWRLRCQYCLPVALAKLWLRLLARNHQIVARSLELLTRVSADCDSIRARSRRDQDGRQISTLGWAFALRGFREEAAFYGLGRQMHAKSKPKLTAATVANIATSTRSSTVNEHTSQQQSRP